MNKLIKLLIKLLESDQLAAELKCAEAMIRNAQKVLAAKGIMPEKTHNKKPSRAQSMVLG